MGPECSTEGKGTLPTRLQRGLVGRGVDGAPGIDQSKHVCRAAGGGDRESDSQGAASTLNNVIK